MKKVPPTRFFTYINEKKKSQRLLETSEYLSYGLVSFGCVTNLKECKKMQFWNSLHFCNNEVLLKILIVFNQLSKKHRNDPKDSDIAQFFTWS